MKAAITESLSRVDVRARLMAALSYLGVLCFIPLLFNRDDGFVNFHARQGVVLWAWSALALLSLTLPGLGWFFRISTGMISMLSLFGLVAVALNKTWKYPLIGDLAEKL
ncbi:MAG: hypothetical protein WCF85_10270 [Rhodospirillaceae bacterium]